MNKNLSILGWGFVFYAVFSLVSMATMSLGAAALITTLIITFGFRGTFRKVVEEIRQPDSKVLFRLAVFLMVACGLSLAVAKGAPLAYGGRHAEIRFFPPMGKIWYLFWPILLALGLRKLREDERSRVLRAWLGAAAVLSVIGIIQFFTGWPRPQVIPSLSHRFHATLFLGHHLSVASIFIFPFFAALDLATNDSARRSIGWKRGWLFLIALLTFTALFLSYSRMLWAALPVGILVWFLWALPKKWKWASAGLLALGIAIGWQVPAIHDRLTTGIGIGERENLWKANWEFFKERPLTGAGWHYNEPTSALYLMAQTGESQVFSGHAHNNFLDMLGGTGLIGTVAWLVWCVGLILILRPSFRGNPPIGFSRGLACAWLVFHLNGLTQTNFWEGKVMHQMSWVIAWSLLWVTTVAPRKEIS